MYLFLILTLLDVAFYIFFGASCFKTNVNLQLLYWEKEGGAINGNVQQ